MASTKFGEDGDSRGDMWVLEQRIDQPMDEEAENMYREKKFSTLLLLRLAYQSLGVVYGIDDQEDVIGALSLIIYSLTLVPLLIYVLIVLGAGAKDNGQGGTLVVYSLLCQHANIRIIPNHHRTDE